MVLWPASGLERSRSARPTGPTEANHSHSCLSLEVARVGGVCSCSSLLSGTHWNYHAEEQDYVGQRGGWPWPPRPAFNEEGGERAGHKDRAAVNVQHLRAAAGAAAGKALAAG